MLAGMAQQRLELALDVLGDVDDIGDGRVAVSYTHLRAHETVLDIVCRLLLEKKKNKKTEEKKKKKQLTRESMITRQNTSITYTTTA